MLRRMRSRASLVAELKEMREQAVLQDLMRKAAVEQCGRANELLEAVRGERDRIKKQLAELRNSLRPAALGNDFSGLMYLRTDQQLLQLEKARADQLAALVDRLQQANMAADRL